MEIRCSSCSKAFDADKEGVKLWTTWFCSMCFIGQAQGLHREIKPEEIEIFKAIAREGAGVLPSLVFELILAGFYRRATGKDEPPPREAVAFTMAELQRATALNNFQREINMLRTWQDMFTDFIQERQKDIQEAVKRLTDDGS